MIPPTLMASCTVLTLCLLLPLAISPWAFDDAYYLKETFLLVVGGVLLCGQSLALWRGRAARVILPVPLLVFLVLAVLSVWRVANLWAFAFRLALFAAGLAVFVTVARSNGAPGRRAQFLKALCVSAVLATGFGTLQQLGLDPFLATDSRFISTFGNPHLYAEFVAPLLPVLLCLVLVAENAQRLAVAMIGFAVCAGGLLWSAARGPALAALAAMVFLLWALRRESRLLLLENRARLWACAGVLAGVTSLMVLTDNLVARKPWTAPTAPRSDGIATAVTPANSVRMGDLGVDFRLAVYRDTLDMIRERPLTGFGLGNFRIVYPRFARTFGARFAEMNDEVVPVGHVHNDLLEMAAELGLPGAIAFLWMLLWFIRSSVAAVGGRPPDAAWPRLAAGAGLVALAINSLFAFGFYDPATSLEFWVFAGITMAPSSRLGAAPSASDRQCIMEGGWRYPGAAMLACLGVALVWLGTSSAIADAFLMRGLARFYTGRYAEAAGALKTAADLEVGRTEAMVMLAQAHLELGAVDHALMVVRAAQSLEPHNVTLLYLRGVALARAGRLEESQRALEEALVLRPLQSLPHVALGDLAERRGDSSRARVEYEAALHINSRRVQARDGLALLAAKDGDLDTAVRLWEEGARLAPGDPTFAHNLSIAYARKGDSARAAYWKSKAAALRVGMQKH